MTFLAERPTPPIDEISPLDPRLLGGIIAPFRPGGSFYVRFFNRFGHMKDDEGRPIHEGEARLAYDNSFKLEFRRCPYPGSRNGGILNFTALKQLGQHWQEVLTCVNHLRHLYLVKYDRQFIGITDSLLLGLAISNVTPYLIYRNNKPFLSGHIPSVLVSTFKASLDVITTIGLMVVREMAKSNYDPRRIFKTAEVVDCAENDRLFLNREFVCAGSVRQVHDFIDALINGQPMDRADNSDHLRAIGDIESFWSYNREMMKQYLIGFILLCKNQQSLSELRTAAKLDRVVEDSEHQYPRVVGFTYQRLLIAKALEPPSARSRVMKAMHDLLITLDTHGHNRDLQRLTSWVPASSVDLLTTECDEFCSALKANNEWDLAAGSLRARRVGAVIAAYLMFENDVLELLDKVRNDIIATLGGRSAREFAGSEEILRALITPRDVLSALADLSPSRQPKLSLLARVSRLGV